MAALAFVVGVVAVAAGIGLGLGTQTAAAQTTTAPDCSTVGYDGAGTTSSPFEVTNVSQLQCMGDANTSTSLSDNFTQTSNIDATGTDQWNGGSGFAPVGNQTDPFNGIFGGAGNDITGLTVDRPTEDFGGLFGVVGTAGSVEETNLVDANITSNSYFGPLAGKNLGAVARSSASGSVTGNNMAGGLIGRNEGTVTDSSADTEVEAVDNLVGGFVGRNLGTVTDSSASGNVSGDQKVGGFVGENQGGTVQGSSATGNVLGVGGAIVEEQSIQPLQDGGGEPGVGGFVGYNDPGGTVELSDAAGNVESVTPVVGGFVGLNEGTIIQSRSTGPVSEGTTIVAVGGFAGQNIGSVDTSEATGSVAATGSDTVGGFVGQNSGTVNDSSATGSITADREAGGFVGGNSGTVNRSSATGGVNGNSLVGGFVGGNSATVNESSAKGAVTGGDRVGGFVGSNIGTVTDVYSRGDVDGNEEVGGVAGKNGNSPNTGNLVRTYATGDVTGNTNVSGVVGFNDAGDVTDSYWDELATGQTNAVGASGPDGSESNLVGFSSDSDGDTRADEMIGTAAETNMTAFAFNPTWATVIDDYPILAWQDVGSQDISTCGVTITSSGAFELTQDITASTNCVEITASDVLLNGNGNSVTGEAGNGATGIIFADGVNNVTVENIFVSDWDVNGIDTGEGSDNNAIRNSSLLNSGGDALEIGGSSVVVENLNIGASTAPGTTLSFVGTNVTLDNVENPPADPDDSESIGRYFDADNTAPDGELANLELEYDDADLGGADESTLSLLNFDGTQWTVVSGSSVDEANNVLTADVTDFSTFGGFTQAQLANFDLEITETTSPINAGENLDVSANITNDGNATDNATVRLITNSTVRDSREIVLSPGLSKEIELTWNTNESDAGEYLAEASIIGGGGEVRNVTVGPPQTDPKFEVDITGTTEPTQAGETLGVEANVENVGNNPGNETVELTVDGILRDTRDVNLDGGDDRSVALEWETNESDAGDVLVEVNTTKDGETRQVTIDEPPEGPNFEVDITGTTNPTQAGETLGVEVTVTNTGDTQGTETVDLVANGSVQDTTNETIAGGESTTVALEWQTTESDAGTALIEANGTTDRDTVSLTIDDPPTDAIFEVDILDTTQPVQAGDTLEVEAEVRNVGDTANNGTIGLIANGTERDTRNVSLNAAGEPGSLDRVVLEWQTTEGDAGERLIEVGANDKLGLNDTGTVTIEEPPTDPQFEPTIDFTTQTNEGGTLAVQATIDNTGDRNGTQEVSLEVGGAERDNETVSIEGGNSRSVVLMWDTTEGDAGGYVAEVTTDDGTATEIITIGEAPEADFAVSIDSTTQPVQAGETLEVVATIENIGDAANTTTAELTANGTTQDTETVGVDAGDSEQVILEWTTTEGDVGQNFIKVSAQNASAVGEVTVESLPTPPNFAVGILGTTSPVQEGETLEVEANVVNTGDTAGTGPVALDVSGEQRDTENVSLNAGESNEVILTWETNESDAADRIARVSTPNDTSTETVTIEEGPTDAKFNINITDTTNPIQAGETLGVEATVTNTGDTQGTETVELIANGSVRDTTNETIAPGDTSTIALEWETTESDAGTALIEVNGTTDRETRQVTIEEPPESKFEIEITDTTEPTHAGETLGVEATVTNTGETSGTETVELIANGTVRDTTNETIAAGDTSTIALEWETTESDAGTALIEVNGTTDRETEQVTIGPPPTDATFEISIDSTTAPTQAGDKLEVEATVENVGETAQNGTIELEANGSVQDNETVDLGAAGTPGDSDTVTLEWATTEADAGDRLIQVDAADEGKALSATGTVVVNSPPTAKFELSISDTTEPTQAGETLGVEATVTNTGDTQGTEEVELLANGTTQDTTNETIAAGDTSTIALEWQTTESDAGTPLIEVNGTSDRKTRQVTIEEPPTDAKYEVSITDTANPIQAGERLEVEATVENTGETAGNETVELIANGTTQDSQDVAVDAKDNRSVVLSWDTTESDAGDRLVVASVPNSSAVETVEIQEPPTDAKFKLSIADTTGPIQAGETLGVDVLVENIGETSGTETVELLANGTTQDTTNETIAGGDSSMVALEWATTEADAGTALIEANGTTDRETRQVTIEEAPDSKFEINITDTTEPTQAGETLGVEATVTNTGDTQGTEEVELLANGTVQDTTNETIDAGDTSKVALEWQTTESDAGTALIEVNGTTDRETRQVTIEEPPTDAAFEITITDTTEPVQAGENLAVETRIENVGETSKNGTVAFLADFVSRQTKTVSLDAAGEPGSVDNVTFVWATTQSDVGETFVEVTSLDTPGLSATKKVTVEEPPESEFDVSIQDTTEPTQAGETLGLDVLVENIGDDEGTDTVELLVGGDVIDNRTVSIDGGNDRNISLEWNTTESDAGQRTIEVATSDDSETRQVEIEEAPEADFEIDITATTEPTRAGETLGVEATVTNTGEDSGTEAVELIANGTVRDTTNETIDAGDTSTIALEWATTESDEGTALIEVNGTTDRETEQVTIGPPPTDATFAISIDSTTAPTQAGDKLEVEATVENVGETAQNGTIELEADGTVQDNETVDLGAAGTPGDSDTVTLEWATTEADAGDRLIQVDAADEGKALGATGTVEITEPPESKFEINVTDTTNPIQAGEKVGIEATVTNTGETSGTETVELIANGTVRDTTNETIAPGDTSTIALEWETTESDVGTVLVEVNGTTDRVTEQITIEEPPAGPTFDVGINFATEPDAGDRLYVEATVENVGEQAGSSPVRLNVAGSQRDFIGVSLTPNESRSVVLVWNTTEQDAGDYVAEVTTDDRTASKAVTVGEVPTDVFEVNITETTEPISAGQELSVEATVKNTGEKAGTQPVELETDGTLRDNVTVDLEPGEKRSVVLTWNTTESDAGESIINLATLDDTSTKKVTVGDPPTDPTFDIEIVRTTAPVQAGETLEVEAEVENVGDTDGTGPVELIAAGGPRDSTTVDLAPGETRPVVLRWDTTVDDVGDFIIIADTPDAGVSKVIEIEEPPSDANFEVNITEVNDPVREEETVEVEANIKNVGDKAGSDVVTLDVAGGTRDTETVSLSAGASRPVVLRWTTIDGDAGEFLALVGTSDSAETAKVTVNSKNEAPVAAFNFVPDEPEVGETVSFFSGSVDPDGSLVNQNWDFGDGATGTGETPSNTYESAGNYTVTLTVMDDEGATDTATQNVTVESNNEAPVADFEFTPTEPEVGQTVSFTSMSSDSDGSIVSQDWDFGDGTTGTGPTPSNTYGTAGNYTVTLTVTDDEGATDTATQTVPVENNTAVFGVPLIDDFDDPPTNTQELDATLYEDLSGDGDGLGVNQTVKVFRELALNNDLQGTAPDGTLTDEEARALNWNEDSPETEVTVSDMVSLFGEQIRAD